MITYSIVHPQPIFFHGVSSILDKIKTSRYKCIGYALHPKDVILKINDWISDLVIIEIHSKNGDELRLIEIYKKKSKDIRILMIAHQDNLDLIRQGFVKGANGYLAAHFTEEELVGALDQIMKNEVVMPLGFRIHPDLNDINASHKVQSRYDFHLTSREKEVLNFICQGLSNKLISQQLFISDQTVAVHRKNLFRKLGVKNSISLMQVAKEKKLIG